MGRLNTDRSIAPIVAQFVPLKIDSDTPEWQNWARKYRQEGNTIPIVYIIRADGQMLYGRSGMLSGNALPQLLVGSLRRAGRVFNDRELSALTKTVAEAKLAHAQGATFEAVRAISAIKKIGTPGDLRSHAAIAVEADQFFQQLGQEGSTAVMAAEKKLNSQSPFEGVLALVEAQKNYSLLPTLKSELTRAVRECERDPALRQLISQAKFFSRARDQARNERSQNAGLKGLERIIARNPDSTAAQWALTEYREVTGHDPPAPSARPDDTASHNPAPRPLRTWTDASGQFKIRARLVEIRNAAVLLEKHDGTSVEVPIAKLSEQDQRYCRESVETDLK